MFLLKLFIILLFVLEYDTRSKDTNKELERLLTVIVDKYIPIDESITLYYDGDLDRSSNIQLKPDEIFKTTSFKYRKWVTKTYRTQDKEIIPIDRTMLGEEILNIKQEEHENMIIYYTYPRYVSHGKDDSVNVYFIRKRTIIFLSGIKAEDILNEISSKLRKLKKAYQMNIFVSLIIKDKDFLLLMEDREFHALNIYKYIPQYSGIFLINRWKEGTMQKDVNLFYKFDWPNIFVHYISVGYTECIYNYNKSYSRNLNDIVLKPEGWCIDIVLMILKKLTHQKIIFLRETGFTTDLAKALFYEVLIDDTSTSYADVPDLVPTHAIGYDNLTLIVLNPTQMFDTKRETLMSLNMNVVIGFIVLGLVIPISAKIISKCLHLQELNSSWFLTMTWSTFLGFSVPQQPTGRFRIIFISFVALSFFIITLFYQQLFSDLTVGSEAMKWTAEELNKRNFVEMPQERFHICYNSKSYVMIAHSQPKLDKELDQYCIYNKTNKYVFTKVNSLELMFNMTYKVLDEYVTRPKLLFVKRAAPIETINMLILRLAQAGLPDKLRWNHERTLLDSIVREKDIAEEEDKEEADGINPVFVGDLQGPFVLIFSLFGLSLIVLFVEIITYKILNERDRRLAEAERRLRLKRTRLNA